MKDRRQSGVALVITLVMLSIVTLMAVTFLAISRRQREAVGVATDYTIARLMAETALNRAEAQILATLLDTSPWLGYDMIVSTNFVNPLGFDPTQPLDQVSPTNVNYDFVKGTRQPLTEQQRLQVIANLWKDPRAPVFVQTNQEPGMPLDFRFYLDLNRNGMFDTNGWQPIVDNTGKPLIIYTNGTPVTVQDYLIGDPEWIGVLANPAYPHSATNRFIGRYAYIVLPTGKSLDLNFIHNNALDPNLNTIGYYRNQGVGSWELNFAAFLHDLNTNAWPDYDYRGLQSPAVTLSMLDALGFLRIRYGSTPLPSLRTFLGDKAAAYVRNNGIDDYTDGPHMGSITLPPDNDMPDKPWSGSENRFRYTLIDELFDTNKVPAGWLSRLLSVQRQTNTYDRYTFYRLLSQLGTDSFPQNRGKININYDNRESTTNMYKEWSARDFVIAAANRMFDVLRVTNQTRLPDGTVTNIIAIGDTIVRQNFSATNIQIYPFNEFTPTVHWVLQLALNIYDATTNRSVSSYPYLPTVLRPEFMVDGNGSVYITNYVEVTNSEFLRRMVLLDVRNPADRLRLRQVSEPVVYNVPLLIGAKKGLPNFNEFAMINVIQVSRKAEVVKRTPADLRPYQTNLVYLLSISNRFGIELWNSYSNAYPRPLRIELGGDIRFVLTNGTGGQSMVLRALRIPYAYTEVVRVWPGKQFLLPVYTNVVVVPESTYIPFPPQLLPADTNIMYIRGLGFYVPQWTLAVSNRFFVAMVDEVSDRLVDFVAFSDMNAIIDITSAIAGQTSSGGILDRLWATNRVGGLSVGAPTEGVLMQMEVSLGNIPVSDRVWRSYNRSGAGAMDKAKAIDLFREFCGLTPLTYTTPSQRAMLRAELAGRVAMQAPFAPIRKFVHEASWQANDPLVHYMISDLMDPHAKPGDPYRTNAIYYVDPPTLTLTNSNLGMVNNRYRPWGGNPNQSYDILANNPAVKDPGVYSSDDWDFPGQKFPNIGWLGRVHRGTPWQTIYLKSAVVDTNLWYLWSGSLGTHPTNDWKIVDVFTTAINENSSCGLLSVNQTNLAAWSAVLAGISVLTNTTPLFSARTSNLPSYEEILIKPNSPQLYEIVSGINRTREILCGITNDVLRKSVGYRARFRYLGEILATPELSLRSPFINTNNLINDEIVERIPQQILGLLKKDEPIFTVYAFGQALKEAPNSVYMGPGLFYQLCTNYQAVSEFAIKAVVRVEQQEGRPRLVIEDYQEIPIGE